MASRAFGVFRITLGLVVVAILIVAFTPHNSSLAGKLPRISSRPPPIPDIFHFTQLRKDEHSELHFSFQALLAVYSALRFSKPSKIYIHTDFNQTMVNHAAQFGSTWTRMMLTQFKEVQINHVEVPTHANGQIINNIEAKSDMVRWEQVYEHGGIYLDWDVLTLRDVRVLREAGFNAIVGRQLNGRLNSGCFMSQKKSALAYLMRRDQYVVFDNGWETHAIALLTHISERLVWSPNEVLILDVLASCPVGWEDDWVDRVFAPHNESAVPLKSQTNDPTHDPILRWDNMVRSREWEIDFSATYLLHAFHSRVHYTPGYSGVSVKYVVERDSNFALAAWPIVQQGIKEGIFDPASEEI